MASYYSAAHGFRLSSDDSSPSWRPPQWGALGALIAHWTLAADEPALVALPTGVGKTAVAMATPHIVKSNRVLVIVPSAELRHQMAGRFADQTDLRQIGALPEDLSEKPVVREITGLVDDWSKLEDADVVVGLPQSLSPAHYDTPPPEDLFDLFVCDEAHHLPAPTWLAILDHFRVAHSVLLTATPHRRDGRKIPGEVVYHYPLRRALEESLFQPVRPRILTLPGDPSQESIDGLIVDEVCSLLNSTEHETSAGLIRTRTKKRAGEVAALYERKGVSVRVLHSGLPSSEQRKITDELRSGEIRCVAIVGMLIEGFDLPRLRIAAYHDKHKSLPATAQLIGRLARVDPEYPQPSELVTVRDIDIYPELEGHVRQLYNEDNDWATVLPGIIDDQIVGELEDRSYAREFSPPATLALEAVHPLNRAIIYEAPDDWLPNFICDDSPAFRSGQRVAGQSIVYAGLNPRQDTLMLVTVYTRRPRWHADPGLDTVRYELHMVSYRTSPRTDRQGLFFINSGNAALCQEVLGILDPDEALRPADPRALQEAFDSLPRVAASNVGVRGRYAGFRGTPSYRMYAGSDIERGLRDSDTAHSALGHAMIQVSEGGPAFTAGLSTGKAKYWETRYTPLRLYDDFITTLAERYWFPPPPPSGPLLPSVSRGSRLTSWPIAKPIAVELDQAVLIGGWTLLTPNGDVPLEAVEFQAEVAEGDYLKLIADIYKPDQTVSVWNGRQHLDGSFETIGTELRVRRGFSLFRPLIELLTDRPPTIYFVDGTFVRGTECFDSRGPQGMPKTKLVVHSWDATDIQAETRESANRNQRGQSIDETLEEFLRQQPQRAKRRWILGNDGPGEIADYIVLEVESNTDVSIQLWHAKSANGPTASVRVTDLEVAVAQAIKSRRWVTDRGLWSELGARLAGEQHPPIEVVEGNRDLLLVLCGKNERWQSQAFTNRPPVLRAQVWIAQPGLSKNQFEQQLAESVPSLRAEQIRQILTVLHDSTATIAQQTGILCSE